MADNNNRKKLREGCNLFDRVIISAPFLTHWPEPFGTYCIEVLSIGRNVYVKR